LNGKNLGGIFGIFSQKPLRNEEIFPLTGIFPPIPPGYAPA